jgi:hypothetical protein
MGRKPRPLLVFDINGANVDVFRGSNVQTASRSVNLVGIGGTRCVYECVAETAESYEDLSVRIKVLVMKDVARSDEVGVFFCVIGCMEAGVVNGAFDAEVPGEIEGSVGGKPADFIRAVVWIRDGAAASDLHTAHSRGRRHSLCMRPAREAKNAGETADKKMAFQICAASVNEFH